MISQGGDGNFRFSSIFHRNLSISLKFPPKNYGKILIFFAVKRYAFKDLAEKKFQLLLTCSMKLHPFYLSRK